MRGKTTKILSAVLTFALTLPLITTSVFANFKVDKSVKNVETSDEKGDIVMIEENNIGLREKSLCLKVGVKYALDKNVKIPIYDGTYGEPKEIDGKIMLPIEAVTKFLNLEITTLEDGKSFEILRGTTLLHLELGSKEMLKGGERVTLNTEPGVINAENNHSYIVVCKDDIEKIFDGYFATYDDMGLVIVSDRKGVLASEDALFEKLDIMKSFIFDYATPNEMFDDLKQHTNNFKHPYLITTDERLSQIRNAYNLAPNDEGFDLEFSTYIDVYLRQARQIYNDYAKVDEETKEYLGLDKVPTNPYPNHGGYDVGGRLNECVGHAQKMMNMALAYQITGEVNYMKCAYDVGIALGEWEHWGPGHFLNCADTSYPFAVAIDLIYNGLNELKANGDGKYEVNKLIEILYTHGTYQGYYSQILTDGKTEFPRPGAAAGQDPSKWTNNWNAVCFAGMTAASLITSEIPEYKESSMKLIEHDIYGLCHNGLNEYAPDGAYYESASYWAYGTNTFFRGVMALMSSTGKDYGLLDTWGIPKTCYFACNIESSDYRLFNYHDCHYAPGQDTSMFFFASYALHDNVIAGVRKAHLKGGKAPNIYDLLYYPTSRNETPNLPLSYVSYGTDVFTARSSWEKKSLFAGIIGGKNDCSHGQIDSGTWTYHDKGTMWIVDPGHDQYNVYQYFKAPTRYRYYKMNAEGNNTLALTGHPDDMPFGQSLKGRGKLVKYGENQHGAYSIIDNASVYAPYVKSAKRGMLVTNDNKTVVIQDEVELKNIETLYWFAHYELRFCKGTVMPDGKSAILYTDSEKVRFTLLSDDENLKFEIMDAYTFVLGGKMGTVDKNFSIQHGGQPEHDREKYRKLAIKAENVKNLTLSVVMEVVTNNDDLDVGYKYTNMYDWEPYADNRQKEPEKPGGDTLPHRDTPKESDIKMYLVKLDRYQKDKTAYGKNLNAYYRLLCDLDYTFDYFKDQNFSETHKAEYEKLCKYKSEYNTFMTSVNNTVTTSQGNIQRLMRIK